MDGEGIPKITFLPKMSVKKASGQEGYLADILRDMGFRKYPEGRNAVTEGLEVLGRSYKSCPSQVTANQA